MGAEAINSQFGPVPEIGPEQLPNTVPVYSLITPLLINFAIAILTLVAFWVASASSPWCYKPRQCRPTENGRRQAPPAISFKKLSWIKTMFSLTEVELTRICGLDALMLIRFHHLGLRFFVPVAILGLTVLVPVNVASSQIASIITFSDLSMGHIPAGSSSFWVHFIMTWLFTAYLFLLLDREVHAYIRLRHAYHLVPEDNRGPRPDQLSICVRRIPSYLRTEDNFYRYFRERFNDKLAAAIIVRDRSVVIALTKQQERARRQLEIAYIKWSRSSGSIEARPKVRVPWFFGQKRDAINYWSHEVDRIQDEINERLRGPSSMTSVGFVTLTSFESVNLATRIPLSKDPGAMIAYPAMEPRDVYWPNIHLAPVQKKTRQILTKIVVFVLIAFWTIPVAAVISFSSPDMLQQYVPFIAPVFRASPLLKGFLNQFLPSICILVFQLLLPPILLCLSKAQGCSSRSTLQISVFTKFFLFQFFNFFLVTVISGSLFDTIAEIIKEPIRTPFLLGHALPMQAATFISYVLLQSLARVPLQLLRINALLIGRLQLKFFVRTPEDVIKVTAPGPFQYSREWPMHIFVFMLGLAYAEITPLILPCTALFFAVSSFVFRYLLIFVHEPKFESGGRLFPLMFSRLIAGVIIGLLTLIGMFALKKAIYQSSLLAILVVLTVNFHMRCQKMIKDCENLSVEEVLDFDKSPRFDIAKFTKGAAIFYRQPCAIRAPLHGDGVIRHLQMSEEALRNVPELQAIKSLIELRKRQFSESGSEHLGADAFA